MFALVAVTLIWAFSFSLVGKYLEGVDPFLTASVRLGLATLCLLPFLRWPAVRWRDRGELLLIGAVQFGVMYASYLMAFRFIEPYLVALFSVFTPLWVSLFAVSWNRRWAVRPFLAAILAVAGAWVIRTGGVPDAQFIPGFLWMQVANVAFAAGQVWFREWKFRHPGVREREIFALPLAGGAILSLLVWQLIGQPWATPTASEWLVLVYLGVVASGLGFFLWNYGSSRVTTGFLAAANNLVVPLALVVAFSFGGRPPAWEFFWVGSLMIFGGLWAGGMGRR